MTGAAGVSEDPEWDAMTYQERRNLIRAWRVWGLVVQKIPEAALDEIGRARFGDEYDYPRERVPQ